MEYEQNGADFSSFLTMLLKEARYTVNYWPKKNFITLVLISGIINQRRSYSANLRLAKPIFNYSKKIYLLNVKSFFILSKAYFSKNLKYLLEHKSI